MKTEQSTATPNSSRWAVRVLVYVMLFLSALAAFTLDDRLWEAARLGSLPVWAPLLPAITFTAFVIIYTIDRALLVHRKNYPAVRAFFQVASAIVFLTLLWPRQANELVRTTAQARMTDPMQKLLVNKDPDVRAAACELAGFRAQADLVGTVNELSHKDPSQAVRAACEQAARRIELARAGLP